MNVLKHSATRGPERAILLALAARANREGIAWPSLSRIAQDAGIDRRTVSRHLANIAASGELEVIPGKGTAPNKYRLVGAQRPHLVGARCPSNIPYNNAPRISRAAYRRAKVRLAYERDAAGHAAAHQGDRPQ